MLYRSLAKVLYHGGKIVTQTEEQINREFEKNLGGIKEEGELAGYIYVLTSLSKNVEIQSLQNLYKVGFSTSTVEKRIANAENEPTYLMSPVKLVAEYEAYNMNTQKFESLLHRFLAPLDVINRAIELIVAGQIQHYRYDDLLKEIVAV